MSVSKWLAEIIKALEVFGDDLDGWGDLILNPTITRISADGSDEGLFDESELAKLDNLPEELPILPLRGAVVYPHTTLPLTIGQPRSIALVDDVVAGDRLVGLVASKNPEL